MDSRADLRHYPDIRHKNYERLHSGWPVSNEVNPGPSKREGLCPQHHNFQLIGYCRTCLNYTKIGLMVLRESACVFVNLGDDIY
jgi:hypothetical protein